MNPTTFATVLLGFLLVGDTNVNGFSTLPMNPRANPTYKRGAYIGRITALAISPLIEEPAISSSTTQNAQPELSIGSGSPLTPHFRKNFRQIDMDLTSNILALVVAISAASFLVHQVDASFPHSTMASLHDIASRLPREIWDSYEAVLTESPIATKAATSASVYTIGDVISQRTEGVDLRDLDRARTLRSMLAGLIGHGPLSHFWYTNLDALFTNTLHISTQWWAFIPKVVVDQSVWGPIWNNSYILLLGLMKLDSPKDIWEDMKQSTVPLITTGLKLWVPAHTITYGLVPVENRLLWVDLVEIAWVTILARQAAGTSGQQGEEKITDMKTAI